MKRNYMRSHIRNQDVASDGINDNKTTDSIAEMALYGDFIIGDYVDSYQNLTLKTFSDRDQQFYR